MQPNMSPLCYCPSTLHVLSYTVKLHCDMFRRLPPPSSGQTAPRTKNTALWRHLCCARLPSIQSMFVTLPTCVQTCLTVQCRTDLQTTVPSTSAHQPVVRPYPAPRNACHLPSCRTQLGRRQGCDHSRSLDPAIRACQPSFVRESRRRWPWGRAAKYKPATSIKVALLQYCWWPTRTAVTLAVVAQGEVRPFDVYGQSQTHSSEKCFLWSAVGSLRVN